MNTMQQLQTAIKDSGLTIKILALKSGVTEGTVSNVLSGRCAGVNSCTADAIAEVLGMKFVLMERVPELVQELNDEA